ncbi:hypothetical protein D3C81_2304280 [compost metagenome]
MPHIQAGSLRSSSCRAMANSAISCSTAATVKIPIPMRNVSATYGLNMFSVDMANTKMVVSRVYPAKM